MASAAVCVLLLALLLPGLGYRHLWQDEIETAERARTILESGLPRVVDASGMASLNAGGKELEEGTLHRYTPWAQFYWAAWGLKLSRSLGLNSDAGVRFPFVLAHAAAATALAGGLTAFGALGPVSAAGISLVWGLESIRLLHNRTARYHALIDLLVVAGLLAVGALRGSALWARPLLFIVIFLLPQVQTLGGSLFSLLLAAGAAHVLWRKQVQARRGAWVRDCLKSLALPGFLSLAVLLVLCRPWASTWGRLDGPSLKSLRDVGGSMIPLLFWSGSGFWLRRRGERGLARVIFWAVGLSVALTALAESHPQSQPRYYLAFGILGFFWPLALGWGGLPVRARQRYWTSVLAALCFSELVLWALPVFINDQTRVHTHAPLQGLRLVLHDRDEARRGARQPLRQALDMMRQGEGPVLIDYVPQFVNWYLPGREPALMPDPVYRGRANGDNPVWDRPRQRPAWHLWYPKFGSGTWECKPGCDFHVEGDDWAAGRYTLVSREMGRQEMCVARTWATQQWNNAPFMNLRASAFQPQGQEDGPLVLARPCRFLAAAR
ncbi:MAG TPA: hypothetical protein DEB40_04810 [Elusimicrobia bacterium]|nr:hypothetical protein [Elusimicrobiota bacterium]HBT61044.1 hypothetical protein [Elusimicrobiota bacterium]